MHKCFVNRARERSASASGRLSDKGYWLQSLSSSLPLCLVLVSKASLVHPLMLLQSAWQLSAVFANALQGRRLLRSAGRLCPRLLLVVLVLVVHRAIRGQDLEKLA